VRVVLSGRAAVLLVVEERGPATYARETCICAIAVMRSAVVGALEFVPSGSVR
jgi:hypothetical protein